MRAHPIFTITYIHLILIFPAFSTRMSTFYSSTHFHAELDFIFASSVNDFNSNAEINKIKLSNESMAALCPTMNSRPINQVRQIITAMF